MLQTYFDVYIFCFENLKLRLTELFCCYTLIIDIAYRYRLFLERKA